MLPDPSLIPRHGLLGKLSSFSKTKLYLWESFEQFSLRVSVQIYCLLRATGCILTYRYYILIFFCNIIEVATFYRYGIMPNWLTQLVMERIIEAKLFWFLVASGPSRLVTVALYIHTCLPEGHDAGLSFVLVQYLLYAASEMGAPILSIGGWVTIHCKMWFHDSIPDFY